MKLKNSILALLIASTFTMFASCTESENNLFGSISGIVTNSEDNHPIQGVTVTLVKTGNSTVTGSDGIYHFNKIEADEYTLQFMATGFQTNTKTVKVEPYSTAVGDIQLSAGVGNLGVDKPSVEFGTSSSNSFIVLKNTGRSAFDFELKYNCNWIKSISPTTGNIKAGANVTVSIEIDRTQLTNANIQKTNLTIATTGGGGMDIQLSVNGSTSGATSTITNGLVGYYNFDNDNAHDLSESKINGILVAKPEFITDTPNGDGKAIFLRAGDGQYLSIPKNPLATSPEDSKIYAMSISFWIKDFGQGQIFSSTNISSYSAYPYFYFANDAFNLIAMHIGYSNTTIPFEKGGSEFQDGKWHHVTYLMDGILHGLYIDGQLRGNFNIYPNHQTVTINAVHFGGNAGLSNRSATNLKLDNIRFYNRALQLAELREIYATEKK